MVFKLNLSNKGNAWKLEIEGEGLIGKSIGDKIEGKDFGDDFIGYELEITGGTDFAGFPLYKNVEGIGLKRVLFKKGWGMKDNRKGIRLRKTVRGKQISDKIVQININVLKEGKKKLAEIFPDQNKKAEEEKKEEVKEEKVEEVKVEEKIEKKEIKVEKVEEKKEIKEENVEEKKEEIKDEKVEEVKSKESILISLTRAHISMKSRKSTTRKAVDEILYVMGEVARVGKDTEARNFINGVRNELQTRDPNYQQGVKYGKNLLSELEKKSQAQTPKSKGTQEFVRDRKSNKIYIKGPLTLSKMKRGYELTVEQWIKIEGTSSAMYEKIRILKEKGLLDGWDHFDTDDNSLRYVFTKKNHNLLKRQK